MSTIFDAPIEPTPMRTCNADGTHHFTELKKLALSGKQYLYACNNTFDPTPAMILGTVVHFLVLGPRSGAKPIVRYSGNDRRGNVFKDFERDNPDAEILTTPEWARAEEIANAVKADPVARARLEGARLEVPLEWDEDGLKFSTSGVDIINTGCLGDLKTTTTTFPDAWTRQAFRMLYPQQLAFYRRGARAHGIDTSKGLFLLGVETRGPFEVVDLELTEGMIAFADRSVALWLEKLRTYKACNEWPGYAQSPVPWDVPAWMQGDDDDEEAA